MKLLELFRSGKDTMQIAEHLGGVKAGWTEAAVYSQLSRERESERIIRIAKPDDVCLVGLAQASR